jgi:Lrp/AsnC family transcriptional regulator for asnA, asnC and gidA
MTPKIDDVDRKILAELQKDGRASFRDLAEKIEVSEGTVYNRVSKLMDIGAIKKFIADIDYTKLGYGVSVLIGLVTEGGKLPEIERQATESPNVNAVYDVTGEYDAVVIAQFRNTAELNEYVKKLLGVEGVKRTNTMLVLNTLKEEHGIWI